MEIKITGNGTSLWGESKGTYTITELDIDYYNDEHFGSLTVYGTNLQWFQYTDKQIEKQVFAKLKALIEQKTNRKLKSLSWSEHGMQPTNGWNFDLSFYKRKRK